MTSLQKIIKYIAIAFAIFLIVNIITAILFGIYSLGNLLGLKDSENITQENLKTISSDITEISKISIECGFTNLQIKSGDIFKVETNNLKISFSENNGNIRIKEENHNWISNRNNPTSQLIIYIPQDLKTLEKVKIESGAGEVNINNLETEILDLEVGAGGVYIENLNVKEKLKLDGGAGKTEIKNSEINNLDAEMGVGEFILQGKLIGKNKIDSGIGAIKINLEDEISNYTIKSRKGIGSISLDGKKIESDITYGSGENTLDIEGGIGSIDITSL